jgi:hypothetical protein
MRALWSNAVPITTQLAAATQDTAVASTVDSDAGTGSLATGVSDEPVQAAA